MSAHRLRVEDGVPPIWRTQAAPALPTWEALLTAVVANAFDDLDVSVALWLAGDYWHSIHRIPSVIRFEPEFGVEARRWEYNQRCFERIRRERKVLRAEHAGFYDLFVPLQDSSGVRAILVTGPFAISRPTSADLLKRWYFLTGAHGRLADPIFAEYARASLATLTLEGKVYDAFERFIGCFAELAGASGDSAALAGEAERLRAKVGEARYPEFMWKSARGMVSDRAQQIWTSPDRARTLDYIGLKDLPEHVVVGLLLGRAEEPDPLDDLLRRDAFQRACVGLARKAGSVVCTQVNDNGIAFLIDHTGGKASTRACLSDIACRAAALARRFGFKLHAGVSEAGDAPTLPARYRCALWAAEKALSQGTTLVRGEPRPERSRKQLRTLRAELCASIDTRSNLLARFERYAEAVLLHCGYRLGPIRVQLEAGLERVAEPLLATGALDEKTFDDLCGAAEESAESAETVATLLEPYRKLFSEMEHATRNPTLARQDRGTRRALSFIREHLNEPLTLAQVARAAGFTPDYFSRIFKRNEGVTFEVYAQRLRIERAKQLLSRTELSIDGVRHLCGFSTRSYFHRVFKRAVGVTPVEYREHGQPASPSSA